MKYTLFIIVLLMCFGCSDSQTAHESKNKLAVANEEHLRQTFRLGYQHGVQACLQSFLTNNMDVSVYAITNDEPKNNP